MNLWPIFWRHRCSFILPRMHACATLPGKDFAAIKFQSLGQKTFLLNLNFLEGIRESVANIFGDINDVFILPRMHQCAVLSGKDFAAIKLQSLKQKTFLLTLAPKKIFVHLWPIFLETSMAFLFCHECRKIKCYLRYSF